MGGTPRTDSKEPSRQGSPKPARNAASPRTGRKRDVEPKEPHVLKFPQFEWYLGPMYDRFREIQIEKALANRVVEVRKKTPREVPSLLPHEKHTEPRVKCFKFSDH